MRSSHLDLDVFFGRPKMSTSPEPPSDGPSSELFRPAGCDEVCLLLGANPATGGWPDESSKLTRHQPSANTSLFGGGHNGQTDGLKHVELKRAWATPRRAFFGAVQTPPPYTSCTLARWMRETPAQEPYHNIRSIALPLPPTTPPSVSQIPGRIEGGARGTESVGPTVGGSRSS